MIQVNDLTQTYTRGRRRVDALQGVSLSVNAGELAVIAGPSGSGKSTLLLAVGAMRRPTSGSVIIDGQDLYTQSPSARAALRAEKLGFVFQSLNLIPYLSAIDNVLLAAQHPSADLRRRAADLLDRLGLSHRMNHRPGDLSQGERQRTAVARAMLNGPKVILADEPTGNLDPENTEAVFAALKQFAHDGGSVIIATHALSPALAQARTFRLTNGNLVEQHPAPLASI